MLHARFHPLHELRGFGLGDPPPPATSDAPQPQPQVATAAEEVRNPGRDLPIGIVGSLSICTVFYILMCLVITVRAWQVPWLLLLLLLLLLAPGSRTYLRQG